jgi:phospholipid/cholesterol/gamma-HCH transport system substrate-binding protein
VTDLMARIVAVFTALLLAATLVTVWVTSHPSASGTEVRAEFDDVYPLLPGMHVRIDGAIAGSVGDIQITDHGTALVFMELSEGTAPPRADATAAIRQQDITGDSYVALEPGDSDEPLGDGAIDTKRTLVAPRFDDLLNSFDEPVRQGLKLILIELAKGLERRGEDLNEVILQLRPGLAAADEALAEVRSQNAALRSLVDDAEAVTAQAAAHHAELGKLVTSLDTTLRTTAEHRPALDAALERLPETTDRARTTLAKLGTLAIEARPLARTLAGAAPDLETTLRRLGPFLDDARTTMNAVGPTLSLVDNLLRSSLPTLREAPSRVLTAPLDIASAAGAVLNSLLGERKLQEALFSADGYGQGPKAADDRGLGAIGVEEGTQAGYPGNDPDRHFLRAETVISCEVFGLPVAPGCLDRAIAGARGSSRASAGTGGGGAGAGGGGGEPGRGSAPAGGAPPVGPPATDDGGLHHNPLGDALHQAEHGVGQVLHQVGGAVGGVLHGGGGSDDGGNGGGPDLGAADDLLDFLEGP